MTAYIELTPCEMMEIDGGCTWCKIGATIITVGGVVLSGCNPIAVGAAVPAIIFTWAC